MKRTVICRHGPNAKPDLCPCERDCYCRDPKSLTTVVTSPCAAGSTHYYVTRDADPDGSLADDVDLWVVRPQRLAYNDYDPGHYWMGPEGVWDLTGHYQSVPVAVMRAWFGTAPDTDLEMIRVG